MLMRNKLLTMVGATALMAPFLANALTLTVDNNTKTVDSITITHTATGVVIKTTGNGGGDDGGGNDGGGGDDGGGNDGGGGDDGGGNDGGGDTSYNCVESSSVVCGPSINWAKPGARLIDTVKGTTTKVWPFTTTSDTSYSGSVSVSERTSFEQVTRRLWISTTPNGPAVATQCDKERSSSVAINWAQAAAFGRCVLQPDKIYYLNIKNTSGCGSNQACGFNRDFL